MSYNSILPEDITVSRADIRENLRALKEDKIVDAATAVVAESATKLANARKISLAGDATGSTNFDGSVDVSIAVDVLSADTSAQCTGNSATATKLETARTISIIGDAAGSADFDGSANVTIALDVTSADVSASCTGNAASATKLEAAHNINGVAFDGTKDITISGSGVPVGTIIAWPSSTLPGGNDAGKWLECNGQSTDGYPDLAVIVGANVPDYRGYFLRGVGGNSADLGVEQGDAIRNITAKVSRATNCAAWVGTTSGAFQALDYNSGGACGTLPASSYSSFSFDASKVVPTATENRPINKAVLYLIKAKQ